MKLKFIGGISFGLIAIIVAILALGGGKWDKYYKNKMCQPPREIVAKALGYYNSPGKALDLGCSVGNEAVFLLDRGWEVWAVDVEPKALHLMKTRNDIQSGAKLTLVNAAFEKLNWEMLPQFDLIYATNALPFCKPKNFLGVWKAIKDKIAPNGRFGGHFFGLNYRGFKDSEVANMTFLTKEQVLELFEGFHLEQFNEIEEDGLSGTGHQCHAHIFEVIAQKKL